MKLNLSLSFIFLITGSILVHAQATDEQIPEELEAPKNHWLISLGGGIANQRALPTYSITSSNLNNNSAFSRSPYLFGRVGYRFQNKHQAAFIIEKTVATNSFTFFGDFQEGLGVNREIDYILANLDYSYNLLNIRRFWFGPSIQLGIGIGNENSSAFFDQGREAIFNTPEGLSFHKYEIVQNSIPSLIYNFGLGANFGLEVIDSRFIIGVDLRWLYSFNAAHEYEIAYQYGSELLDFTVNSRLSNINLGIKLEFLF